jgi:hypothetical protein
MRIDQRNAGASITLSTTTQYPVDRFASYKGTSGATVTAQQSSTAPTGFVNSIVYTVSTGSSPAAGDINGFWQQIEGTNVSDLAWGSASALPITVSFWVRASVTGTYSFSLNNSAVDRFYVATYTVNSANTWEYKTIAIAGDTSGTWLRTTGVGIQIVWDLGYGSNFNGTAGSWGSSTIRRTSGAVQLVANTGATLYITGVQLETGSVATPFERRPFGTELMLCQRYYIKYLNSGTNTLYAHTGVNISSTRSFHYVALPVPMRSAPSVAEVGAVVGDAVGSNLDVTAISVYASSANSINLDCTHASGYSVSVPLFLGLTASTGYFELSSEL